jgi:hypothetical protein
MNISNENIIRKLTVKITSKQAGESGTGVFLSQSHFGDKIYVLTAKHCICGSGFNYKPSYQSIFLEINSSPNSPTIEYQLTEEDNFFYTEENEPDIAIIILNKATLDFKIPFIDVVTDRKELESCIISGYPKEFSHQTVKSIACAFDLSSNSKLELSPQSSINTVEHDNNLDSIRGMSGGPVFLKSDKKLSLHGIVDEFGEWERFTGTNIKLFNNILESSNHPSFEITDLELDRNIVHAINQFNKATKEEVDRNHHRNMIGDLHIDRFSLLQEIESLVENNQTVIIHGNAGVGKSVISYEVLDSQKGKKSLFILRGRELLSGTLAEFLNAKNINCSLEEMLDSSILLSEKIFYIDALEHILETQKIEAIESLLAIAKRRKDVKILISIRTLYVKQLISLLEAIVPQPYDFKLIPDLSNQEIEIILKKYQWIEQLLSNNSISELLRNPFYLNQTINIFNASTTSNNTHVNKRDFVNDLWIKVIKKKNPFREEAFQDIVLNRAKSMTPYIKPHFTDTRSELLQALSELHQDEVVISDEGDYGDLSYAPAHDIFDDWGLIKYIDQVRCKTPEVSIFFEGVGYQIALRRGFRLWVSDQLDLKKLNDVYDSFIRNIQSFEGEGLSYWKDEIILSILKSEQLETFYDAFNEQLKDNNASLFKVFVRLLLLISRPIHSISQYKPNVFIDNEIERAWDITVHFLNKIYTESHFQVDWMLYFLKSWNERANIELIGKRESINLNTLCQKLMLKQGSSISDETDKNNLFDAFINSSAQSKDNLDDLLSSAIEFEREKAVNNPIEVHKYGNYFGQILEKTKSGQESIGLCYLLPDRILEYTFNRWKPKTNSRPFFDSNSVESKFGLNEGSEHRCWPASPYQTPIYYLLKFHSKQTVKKICQLLNFTALEYTKKKSHYRNELIEIELQLESQQPKKFIGSSTLWSMFRSTGQVSPDLLQSILMALEKYLLELSRLKNETSISLLKELMQIIYDTSNNVSPIAVISSVAMAHEQPVLISNFILPLFQVREFFDWDIRRYTGDFNPLAPMGNTPIIQIERHESNQLPHRKSHLENFLIKLSLTSILFKDITTILDKHLKERKNYDATWSLALNRMDIRKFEIQKHPERGQIELKPKLNSESLATVKKYEKEYQPIHTMMEVSNWLIPIINREDFKKNDFETWNSYFETVIETDKDEGYYDSRAGIAFVGLKYHYDNIDSSKRQTCINFILESIEKVIFKDTQGIPYIGSTGLSIRDSVLLAFPIFLQKCLMPENEAKELIIYAIFGLSIKNNLDLSLFQRIAEDLWDADEYFANIIFRGLYHIKEIHQYRPRPFHNQEEIEVSKYAGRLEEFYGRILNDDLKNIDVINIKIEISEFDYLDRVLHFIPNRITLQKEQIEILSKYAFMLQESFFSSINHHKLESYRFRFQKKLAHLLLNQPTESTKQIFNAILDISDLLLKKALSEKGIGKAFFRLLNFVGEYLEYIVVEQDSRDDTSAFWIIWKELYEWNKRRRRRGGIFIEKLLLNISWNDNIDDWRPIQGKGQFFMDIIKEVPILAGIEGYIVNLASRAGFEELGVSVIPEVVGRVKNNGIDRIKLKDAELWVGKLFALRRKELINSQNNLQGILYILNQMVEKDSSVAFHIRDVLISYVK